MIDFHMHSNCSDGTGTPTALIHEAQELGLSAIALTDHDTIAGIPEFVQAGGEGQIHAIPGVEVSIDIKLPNNGHMHLLGLFIDATDNELQKKLDFLKEHRNKRAEHILSSLGRMGIEISMDELVLEAGEGAIGRPHVAKILLRKGVVVSLQEAFDKYLAKGQPAYVDKAKFAEQEAIDLVRNAGGLAILAHPHFMGYAHIEETVDRILQLRDLGLDGYEVHYPNMPAELALRLTKLAQTHGFVVSGGSDYHGENKPGVRMGLGTGDLNVPDQVFFDLQARALGNKAI